MGYFIPVFVWLAHDFRMAHVDPRCFCGADDETLEHLFFECELARLLVAWVFFNLMSCNPTAWRFSVDELLFGFSVERRRAIPSIIIYMLQVMKHYLGCSVYVNLRPSLS